MRRSTLQMKLVLIMVLLIVSLMAVVGAFLINSVTGFYLKDFYNQINNTFGSETSLMWDLQNETEGEENGAEHIKSILDAYAGSLGVDGRNRNYYILDMEGNYLAGSDDEGGPYLDLKPNLLHTMRTGEVSSESSVAADYMDAAIPIQRGDDSYIIYILDNRDTVENLNAELFRLIIEAPFFGMIISVLLSFLLSRTVVTPIRQLTAGAEQVAAGDFSRRLPVNSDDEIGVLTNTFNEMAGRLKDTIQQVENERDKLDTLFLHMTDGVVAFSNDGQVIQSNPAAEKMLCRPISQDSRYEEMFGDVVPLEQVLELERPNYLQSQREVNGRYLELLLTPFDQNSQAGALVVLHDMTDMRRNEELRREFVANVSHELRTPLTNIRSYAETLADNAGEMPPDTEKDFLGVILAESDRMTHIVQDLLTLSRLDAGQADLKLTSFPFDKAVSEVYNAVLLEAQRHDHAISLHLEPDLPEIVADRERIIQVMMNVVSNSIKYTPDGGTISITAGREGDQVWMQVDDNGIGIPDPKDRARIFERFYRVDKARSRESGGTGLGLSIAKEIVDRHQGVLELVDKAGPGLAIRMTLPVGGPGHG